MDAESIGELAKRGHVRLDFIALDALDGGAVKTGTLGQLRLSQRFSRPEPSQVFPDVDHYIRHASNLRSLIPPSVDILAQKQDKSWIKSV
jgi:hypothetical protein